MKAWKITRAQDRLIAARSKLGDHVNPPDRIVCPAGMNSRTYENLIEKVERLEAFIARSIIAGLKPK